MVYNMVTKLGSSEVSLIQLVSLLHSEHLYAKAKSIYTKAIATVSLFDIALAYSLSLRVVNAKVLVVFDGSFTSQLATKLTLT